MKDSFCCHENDVDFFFLFTYYLLNLFLFSFSGGTVIHHASIRIKKNATPKEELKAMKKWEEKYLDQEIISSRLSANGTALIITYDKRPTMAKFY